MTVKDSIDIPRPLRNFPAPVQMCKLVRMGGWLSPSKPKRCCGNWEHTVALRIVVLSSQPRSPETAKAFKTDISVGAAFERSSRRSLWADYPLRATLPSCLRLPPLHYGFQPAEMCMKLEIVVFTLVDR